MCAPCLSSSFIRSSLVSVLFSIIVLPFNSSYKINNLSTEAQLKGDLESEDYYINKQGLLVFTEKYHLKRGYCCGSGCLHCPFNHENVKQ
ncbi:MAG: DUF5522 domain-containing protein [Ekhidna sp.]|uniref:DUF5522 domain-containing protein n=1 Tax=Ekhidna sp. TaxID=2608089 RepID=UPI0032EE0A6C